MSESWAILKPRRHGTRLRKSCSVGQAEPSTQRKALLGNDPTSAENLLPRLDPEDLLRSIIAVDRDEIAVVADELAALVLHDDADVREEAIRKLYHARQERSRRERLLDMLVCDEGPVVRETAALAIAATTSGDPRVEDTRQLARVLLDDDQFPSFAGHATKRSSCCTAVAISRHSHEKWTSRPPLIETGFGVSTRGWLKMIATRGRFSLPSPPRRDRFSVGPPL